VNSKRNFLDKN